MVRFPLERIPRHSRSQADPHSSVWTPETEFLSLQEVDAALPQGLAFMMAFAHSTRTDTGHGINATQLSFLVGIVLPPKMSGGILGPSQRREGLSLGLDLHNWPRKGWFSTKWDSETGGLKGQAGCPFAAPSERKSHRWYVLLSQG